MAFHLKQWKQIADRFAPPAFVFATSLIVYSITLCPTVYVGDSAEFITNSFTLGINHPTGYPLYTILTRLWILLFPFGTTALAVNVFSALATSATVVCVYLILEQLTNRRTIAIPVALMLGVSSAVWSRATSAEVYALSNFFLASTMLVALRWYRDRSFGQLAIAAYLTGLGLSQHATGVLAAPALILFVISCEPRIVRDARTLLMIAGLFLAGLSIYLFLHFRALADPPVAWGETGTFSGFLRHLLPVSGKGLALYFRGSMESRITWFAQRALAREFWYFGAIALFAIPALFRQWRLLVLFGVLVLVNILFAVSRSGAIHADFDATFIPTYAVMAILMGVAIAALHNRWRKLGYRGLDIATAVALSSMVLITARINYGHTDRSHNYFGITFGRNLFSPVESNAVVFTIGDEQTFLGWYLKNVERSLPGVAVIDTRLLGTRWGRRQASRDIGIPLRETDPVEQAAQEIIRSNVGRRPIYFTHRLPWGFLSRDYEMLPIGMLIQILPKGSPLPYRPADFTFHPGWETVPLDDRCSLLVDFYPKEYVDHAQFWLDHQNIQAAQAELDKFFSFPYRNNVADIANALLLQSLTYFRSGQTTKAITYTDSALALSPSQWRAFEYRGNFRFLQKDTAGAVKDWEASLRLNPGNTAVRNILNAMPKKRS